MSSFAWTIYSWKAFNSFGCSSYAKNKQQMCRVTQHQCRSRQMWKIFTYSPSTLTFCLYNKMTVTWLNNLFMVSFQLIRLLSYAKNKLQMCWVSSFCNISECTWWICENFPHLATSTLILSDSTHLLFVLALESNLMSWKLTTNRLFRQV